MTALGKHSLIWYPRLNACPTRSTTRSRSRTDVVTRVARTVDGENVASGTAGRVVGTHGDELDVRIIGVGVLRYRRADVAPFRSGQLRYALVRDAAWNALYPNVVLEATVRKRGAWPTNSPTPTDADCSCCRSPGRAAWAKRPQTS